MGAMLISSLIIFPALTSMRIFKSFFGVVLSSGIVSVVCFCHRNGIVLYFVCSGRSQRGGGQFGLLSFVWRLAGSRKAAGIRLAGRPYLDFPAASVPE